MSEETKHTKGPLEPFPPDNPTEVKAVHGSPSMDESELIPIVKLGIGKNTQKNAVLFASAPDMAQRIEGQDKTIADLTLTESEQQRRIEVLQRALWAYEGKPCVCTSGEVWNGGEMLTCPICDGAAFVEPDEQPYDTLSKRIEELEAEKENLVLLLGRKLQENDSLTTELAESKAEVDRLKMSLAESIGLTEGARRVSDRLTAQVKELREVLMAMVDLWVDLAKSGDAGFWDPEVYDEVKQARTALKNTEPKSC